MLASLLLLRPRAPAGAFPVFAAARTDDTQAVRQGDWSQDSTRTRAQSTPPLAPDTYLLLDLPAGDYNWRLGDGVQSMTLDEGQITVMNMWRRLGNSWGLDAETEAWWRDRVQRSRSRHAFFAEPPDRGWAAVVPYFVNLAPRRAARGGAGLGPTRRAKLGHHRWPSASRPGPT